MKKFIKLVFSVAILSIIYIACQPKKEAEKSNKSGSEPLASKTEDTATVVAESKTVLNANLATEADLNNIGLPAAMVTLILEKRPFLSMSDFDALVDAEVNKEVLYKKIFVPFNINTTPEADFKMIPGVGDRMAHEFEEYKPYTSIQQFKREIGKYVDENKVAGYLNYVFVPVELNTASENDIKALPGVGDRIAHEFEEYRPYTSIEQFRKEIGKYVDDKELARLERFVYLKE